MAESTRTITMRCPKCTKPFAVLQELFGRVKCPNCKVPLSTTDSTKMLRAALQNVPEKLVGTNVREFTIQQMLFKDTTGFIFKAHDNLKRISVALKFIPLTDRNRDVLKHAANNSRSISMLDHPNILKMFDIGIHEHFVFVATELIPGKRLAQLVQESVFLEEEALKICRAILDGLKHAHSKGVIHGNICPESVFVTEKGVAKLIDFGIAMRHKVTKDPPRYVAGTPLYIAPELWKGAEASEQSDLYSVACIMYSLLTGNHPYGNVRGLNDLMKAHTTMSPVNPRFFKPNMNDRLIAVLNRALSKELRNRYQDAEEFRRDIELFEAKMEPKSYQRFGSFIKCTFCGTQNSITEKWCKICKEPLLTKQDKVEQKAPDYFNCNACGEKNAKPSLACAKCQRPFCKRCRTRVVVIREYCHICVKKIVEDAKKKQAKATQVVRSAEEVELEIIKNELRIASDIQAKILPERLPEIHNFEISVIYEPELDIGGDYYDFFHVSPSQCGTLIADVSGHGIPAALVMVATYVLTHVKAQEVSKPVELMKVLNKFLGDLIPSGNFVTMQYGIIDSKTRTITLASCGHTPAILYRKRTDSLHYVNPAGMPLGVLKGEKFDEKAKDAVVRLGSGDKLIFYTDGVTEAMNASGDQFGSNRLLAAVKETKDKSPEETLSHILARVKRHRAGAPQSDDLTMVAFRCTAADETSRFPTVG